MIFAAVSSGRSDLETSREMNEGQAARARRGNAFHRSAAARGRHRIETRGAHRDDLDRIGRLHGGKRVAGVDRAHESVWRSHLDNFRNLLHIQQRRHARRHVLAVGRRRREDVGVALGQADDHRGNVLGEEVGQVRSIGVQDFGDTGNFSRRFGRCAPEPLPATSTWMSPPIFAAAATVLSVATLIVLLSCSAMTREVMKSPCLGP